MKLAYVVALAFSATTPALAQTIVVNPQPGQPPVERHEEKNAARAEERAANAEAAAGNYHAANRDAAKAAEDRAAAHSP